MPELEPRYTIPEIARMSGCSVEYIRMCCNRSERRIPHLSEGRKGGKRTIRWSAFLRWLDEEEQQPCCIGFVR